MSEIVVVRHGQTDWSVAGKHTGRTDVPLTEEGRERARHVGTELARREFALVLCSPMLRARETCALAGFGDVAEICDELQEWDYGDYEGLTTPEIRERRPDWNLWRDGCPGGERPGQIGERADSVLRALREADGDRLVFAHGHILRVLTARWLGMEVAAGARFALSAGGISALGYERETEVIVEWNRS